MTIDQLCVEPPTPSPLQLERSASTLSAAFIDFPPKTCLADDSSIAAVNVGRAMAAREAIYKTDYLISHN